MLTLASRRTVSWCRPTAAALVFPAAFLATLLNTGCARIEIAPIEVKPIHITMDINLRIDRSLDEFFSFQQPSAGPAVAPPTQPAAPRPVAPPLPPTPPAPATPATPEAP